MWIRSLCVHARVLFTRRFAGEGNTGYTSGISSLIFPFCTPEFTSLPQSDGSLSSTLFPLQIQCLQVRLFRKNSNHTHSGTKQSARSTGQTLLSLVHQASKCLFCHIFLILKCLGRYHLLVVVTTTWDTGDLF